MDDQSASRQSRPRRVTRIALGSALAATVLLAAGELFIRRFPSPDLHRYLGASCPTSGPYRPHATLAVTYRTWDQFQSANADRLAEWTPIDRASDRPVWAMFGNSFVQAPEMLADAARKALPDVRIFNLGQNEPLPVRFAQIELLLDHGLPAERILVELMPTDVIELGRQPLRTWNVSPAGALVFEPGLPPEPFASLVGNSRLALAGWCRLGRHHANPRFHPSRLCKEVVPTLEQDLRQLFGHLVMLGKRFDVPITVLLIPTWHQLCVGESWEFQDRLAPQFRALGLDVLDVREPFLVYPNKADLFIPDKHFSEVGNRVLLDALVGHWSAEASGR